MRKHYNVYKLSVKRQILTFYSSGWFFFSKYKQRLPNGIHKQLTEILFHAAHDFPVEVISAANGGL